MKKIGLTLFTLCLLASSAAFADKNKTVSTKFGEKPDDVPCTCVFNKNRMWNPEKIVWNNEEWECGNYNNNGICDKVQKVEGAVVE